MHTNNNEENNAHECSQHHHNHEACCGVKKGADIKVASEKQDAEKHVCSHSCCGDKTEVSETSLIQTCSC
jgi:hypothetical protein